MYRNHSQKAKIFADDKHRTANRFRKQGQNGSSLDFLLYKANAHKDGNQKARNRHDAESRRLDHMRTVKDRPFAEQDAKKGKRNRQEHDVIEHLVSNGFAEGVQRDNSNILNVLHEQSPRSKRLPGSDADVPCVQSEVQT